MSEQLGISSRRQLRRVLSDGYGPAVPAWPDRCLVPQMDVGPLAPSRWSVSAAPGARRGHGDGPAAQAAVYRWSAEKPWRPLSESLPDPQDSISYSLSAASQVFAGLADGRIDRTPDRGATCERLSAQADAIVALAAVDVGG